MLCYILEISSELKRRVHRAIGGGRVVLKRKRTCNPGAISARGSEVTDDTGKPMQHRWPQFIGTEWRCEQLPDLNH